jgi:hypothetical protein
MILANTTAIGMHTNTNDTPLSKVLNLLFWIVINTLRLSSFLQQIYNFAAST